MKVPTDKMVIFILSVSRWDQGFSSASISMARELSRTNKVYYIDHPFSIKDVLKNWGTVQVNKRLAALFLGQKKLVKIDANNPNLIAFTPLVILPINWLPEGPIYNFFSWLNNSVFCYSLKKIIKDENISDFIYWNSYNPFFSFRLSKSIKPLIYIYQSRDNIAASNYVKKHGPRLERITARYADLRLATSIMLTKMLSESDSRFTFFPNAANVSIFKSAFKENYSQPKELQLISNSTARVIGYIGNICLRQDYDLIYKIATVYSNYTLLLVGPRNDSPYNRYDFSKLNNVVFTGPKVLEDLPQYLAFMDVTILPFLINELTRGIYPLKLNEYLAAGKPVVSTNFSEDIAMFSDYIYLSNTHEEFLANIERALNENTEQKKAERVKVAEGNSWQVRCGQFWQLVQPYLKR